MECEARGYAKLACLPGYVHLYGRYRIWNMLAKDNNTHNTPTIRNNMKAALRKVHTAGYIHGDIARLPFSVHSRVLRTAENPADRYK